MGRNIVIDVLFIKRIEREIGRKLDALELEQARFEEPIFTKRKDGTYDVYHVPVYKLPDDLLPTHVDLRTILEKQKKGGNSEAA